MENKSLHKGTTTTTTTAPLKRHSAGSTASPTIPATPIVPESRNNTNVYHHQNKKQRMNNFNPATSTTPLLNRPQQNQPTSVPTSAGTKTMAPTNNNNPPLVGNNNNNKNNNGTAMDVSVKSVNPYDPYHLRVSQMNNGTQRTFAASKNEDAINDLRKRIPEIEKIFDVHSRIGNGTFSTVLLGTLKKERILPDSMKRKFAIKHHIPTSHPDRIMKELQCMAKIGGTNNVVGINCCIRFNESVAFIMPYLAHDRFHDFFNRMEVNEMRYYMKNLLIALRHVHQFNVIHRDVKPSNFLYNRRRRQFLLVDFGLAQQVPAPQMPPLPPSSSTSIGQNTSSSSSKTKFDGTKRPREIDNDDDDDIEDIPGMKMTHHNGKVDNTGNGIISSDSKRLRYSGPQQTVQQLAPQTAMGPLVAGPFKMPLKQLNEISTPGKSPAASVAASISHPSNVNESTNGGGGGGGGRSMKPTTNINSRMQRLRGQPQQQQQQQQQQQHHHQHQQQQQSQQQQSSTSNVANGRLTIVNALNPQTESNAASTAAMSKYNANRNSYGTVITTNAGKCYCYGQPQICNICLVKKEIHASRAGTPGYRPPEVLLKFPDQTTAVDMWAAGVILLSILSGVYPFFKAPNDFVALAEMVTIFGDKSIRKTASLLDRMVSLSQKTKPLDLQKLCVRFRNRAKYSSSELLRKYQCLDGSCEVCRNCDQFFFNCLCQDTTYETTEPITADDHFPESAYDLLDKLLEVNPHNRITADEALNHPFFTNTQLQQHQQINNNNNNAIDPVILAPTISGTAGDTQLATMQPPSQQPLLQSSQQPTPMDVSTGNFVHASNDGIAQQQQQQQYATK